MQPYIIRRLLLIVPTMLIVSLIVFLSMRLIPGDVLDYMVSLRYMSAGAMEALREQLGLNLPGHVQYGRWISGVFQGDFGKTLLTNLAVEEVILERLPRSLELGALALTFAPRGRRGSGSGRSCYGTR
ncbi:MAG: ABC transporter permease [Spirochaetaceae bacterium]|nr:ABC transporter permease [Spirochaetaceae bacterium]